MLILLFWQLFPKISDNVSHFSTLKWSFSMPIIFPCPYPGQDGLPFVVEAAPTSEPSKAVVEISDRELQQLKAEAEGDLTTPPFVVFVAGGTRLWQGHPMCQAQGGIQLDPPEHRGFDEGRGGEFIVLGE